MIFLILAFALIALVDIPKLVQGKYWRDLWVFSGLFVLSFVLLALHLMGVQIPSPIKGIMYFFQNVIHIAYPTG